LSIYNDEVDRAAKTDSQLIASVFGSARPPPSMTADPIHRWERWTSRPFR